MVDEKLGEDTEYKLNPQKQLEKLTRDVEEWNQWRDENPKHPVELCNLEFELIKADLQDANLTSGNLEGTNLSGASLDRANLKAANLQNTNLSGTRFTEANLTSANLTNATLHNAGLADAKLIGAKLANADLFKAYIANAHLEEADLRNSNMTGADLRGAVLYRANLENAKIHSANLTQTNLTEARLDRALLSSSSNYLFNHTSIKGTRGGQSHLHDPWSVLRRKYTGPSMTWTVMALLVACIPYITKALYWSAVNNYQNWTQGNYSEGNFEMFRVFEVILGFEKGFYFSIIPLMLLIYNLLRGYITYRVAPMRDEEERSGFTPGWKPNFQPEKVNTTSIWRNIFVGKKWKENVNRLRPFLNGIGSSNKNNSKTPSRSKISAHLNCYFHLYQMHKVVEFIFLLAIIVFFYNAIFWMIQPIWIPIPA